VNSLPKTVTQQHRGCDLNPCPAAPELSTLTTRLPRPLSILFFWGGCALYLPVDCKGNKAVVDIRLRPRTSSAPGGSVVYMSNPCHPLLSHFEYTLFRVAYSWPFSEKTTSSLKQEVHNVSKRCYTRTEPHSLPNRGHFVQL